MKSKYCAALYVITFCVVLFNVFFFVKDQLFFKLDGLPEGNYVYASLSPDGTKSANFYRVDSPEGSAVRVEIIELDSEMNEVNRQNLYWDVNKTSVSIGWLDNNVITVDGVAFDISRGDSYDCRRKTSFSQKW